LDSDYEDVFGFLWALDKYSVASANHLEKLLKILDVASGKSDSRALIRQKWCFSRLPAESYKKRISFRAHTRRWLLRYDTGGALLSFKDW